MADIDVVKKGSSSWMWILAAVAAVVLLWLLWNFMGSDDETTAPRGDVSRGAAFLTMAQNATDHLAPP